jgi:hypothetical protein
MVALDEIKKNFTRKLKTKDKTSNPKVKKSILR